MQTLTGIERIKKALHREEPDRVPHFELTISPKVYNAILPDASYEDFVDYMDLDGMLIFDKMNAWKEEPIDPGKKVFRDQWGALIQYGSEVLAHPIEPAIKSLKDLDNYKRPDPDEEWRYEKLKAALKRFDGQRAVMAHVTDVFDIVKDSFFGDVDYFVYLYEHPEAIDMANEIVEDFNVRYLKNCIELGSPIVAITGDFAITQGPFVSPEHTGRFLTPSLKKEVDVAHGMGVPAFKHTDGNIWKIFDLLIDTGIDGIHPIDPSAGMKIDEVKQTYGEKVCIMGNVDCGWTLVFNSEEEVDAEVKDCIKKAGYGGGYICMSSNSIHSGVKPENYKAMVHAIKKYGTYPLEV